jgi:hypothetical protein
MAGGVSLRANIRGRAAGADRAVAHGRIVMDAARYEQAVNAQALRGSEVGAHRIADRQHAGEFRLAPA